MTREESRAWRDRLRAYNADLNREDADIRRSLEAGALWFDTAFLAEIDFRLRHTSNLLMMYAHQMLTIRSMTRDPAILWEIDFALAFDDTGRPELAPQLEAELRAKRRRCWEALLDRAREKREEELRGPYGDN